jgi:hypothetical protein
MTPSHDPPADGDAEIRANPGYALGQIARALTTSQHHPDSDTRLRADQKITRWIQVFTGMLSGALHIGSRTPLKHTPAWATLEVVQGGFATGALLAGGPLQPHEQTLLAQLPPATPGTDRAALNALYLSEAGLADLQQLLAAGTYRIAVPEEGALLVVAWLLKHDASDEARAILEAIGPYLHQLRFYPIPDQRPLAARPTVYLQDVATTIRRLDALTVPVPIQRQAEAILIWTPIYDQIVALFAETLEGPIPILESGTDGRPLRTASGSYHLDGGWPCQRYPAGWRERASAVLAAYQQQRAQHQLCGKPEEPRGDFRRLREYLARCVADPARLTGRDVGMIRLILALIAARRGLPGSARWQQVRQAQQAQIAAPSHRDLAQVVIARLERFAPHEGLEVIDRLLDPVTPEEAARFQLPPDRPLPASFEPRLLRSLDAPVEVLVKKNVIASGEVLARVFAQLTAQIRSAGIADPDLRRLACAIYTAFSRRRSLLLLNLEHQVKLTELPWMQAVDARRDHDAAAHALARQTLSDLVTLALTAFPHQIMPNKLLQQIRTLAASAGLELPIVDELAADIFMGEFSEKYLRATQTAAGLLAGTLYEHYYHIDYAAVGQINDVTASRYGTPTSPAFAALCHARAGQIKGHAGQSVARNGTIIEQQQILTTQNLAVLVDALGLAERLRPQLGPMTQDCFRWICRRQQMRIQAWHPRLKMVKNTAYAWRQMIFYLSCQPPVEVAAFLDWAAGHLRQQAPAFQARFQPVLDGLAAAASSVTGSPGAQSISAPAPMFLGWTTERHWLLV